MAKHELFICSTCRFSADERADEAGVSGGAHLYTHVNQALAERGALSGELEVQEFACLMGCENHCNVHIRRGDKIGYTLGKWEPTRESAEAILDYAEKYVESDSGQVPFKQWPDGVKGHFCGRVPAIEGVG